MQYMLIVTIAVVAWVALNTATPLPAEWFVRMVSTRLVIALVMP